VSFCFYDASPQILFDRHTHRSENLSPVIQKEFCNTICQKRKTASATVVVQPALQYRNKRVQRRAQS
jgi:hypothetical protein